jgi:pimeloyl-ACP methyl ester carboxylesterase
VPFTEVNGQRLYYEEHGEGEPLLCVMGLGTDVSGWRLQVPAWSRSFRMVVFDNRDVGRSSYTDAPYEVVDMASDTLALADSLELESFHLLGISLGGAIAQELALAVPDRVLTLTACVSWGGGGRWARERARLDSVTAAVLSDEELLDQMLLLTLSERLFERADQMALIREQILAYPYPQRREGFIRQLGAGARHEARDRLGGLTMPVHVIGAEQDVLVPVWKSRELAALIPGARLSIVEGSPHAVNVEQAGELNRLVLEFLGAPVPGAR